MRLRMSRHRQGVPRTLGHGVGATTPRFVQKIVHSAARTVPVDPHGPLRIGCAASHHAELFIEMLDVEVGLGVVRALDVAKDCARDSLH